MKRFTLPFCYGLMVTLWAVNISQAVTLPTPVNGVNSLTYGDFNVYSMALLNFQASGGTSFSAASPYYVASSPGQIGPPTDFVVATFPGGNRNNASLLADNAWGFPMRGVSLAIPLERMRGQGTKCQIPIQTDSLAI